MKKRLISLLLVLVTLLSLPSAAFAAGGTAFDGDKGFYINPLYADVVTEADLVRPDEASPAAAIYVSSVDDAGLHLRETMKARQQNITFQTRLSYSRQLVENFFASATTHTGVPIEGDYLMWQFAGYQWDTDLNGSTYTIRITITYYTSAAQEKTVTSTVNSTLSKLNLQGKSSYAKVKAIYDYICTNITYDYVHLNDSNYYLQYTAYGALINKTAVCQGYAVLLYRMALESGIDCRVITGWGGGPHAWNIIKLGNLYYDLDSTWDAEYSSQGRYDYNYFLRCENNFPDHYRNDEYNTRAFHKAYPMSTKDFDRSSQSAANGFVTDKGRTYYYVDGIPQTGLVTVRGQTYYFSAKDGHMLTGLVNTGSGVMRYFSAKDGHMLTGLVNTGDGVLRYFSAKDGHMLTGLINAGGGKTYYASAKDGHIFKSTWVNTGNGRYYYCSADGHILKNGKLNVGGQIYYVDKNGLRKTGIVNIGGNSYYFSTKDGHMLTGLIQGPNGKQYYASLEDGHLIKSSWVYAPNGRVYLLDENGVVIYIA